MPHEGLNAPQPSSSARPVGSLEELSDDALLAQISDAEKERIMATPFDLLTPRERLISEAISAARFARARERLARIALERAKSQPPAVQPPERASAVFVPTPTPQRPHQPLAALPPRTKPAPTARVHGSNPDTDEPPEVEVVRDAQGRAIGWTKKQ